MDIKRSDRNKSVAKSTQNLKISKEARMILLITRIKQTHDEDLKEQMDLLEIIKNTRNDIKKELNICKGIEEDKEEVEEQVENIKTETKKKTSINPNLEIIRKIKITAKPKVNMGNHNSKETNRSYSNSNGVKLWRRHIKSGTSSHDLPRRPPFK